MNIEWFKKGFERDKYGLMTRTKLYLAPAFGYTYPEISKILMKYSTLVVCLGDVEKDHINSILFLLNLDKKPSVEFSLDLAKLRNQDCYIEDYLFGDLIYDKLHAIVFGFPDHYLNDYRSFLLGKYSKLFKEDRNKIFNPKRHMDQLNVMNKDPKLQKAFSDAYEWLVDELDQKPIMSEEFLNDPDFDPTKYSMLNLGKKITWL